jgi:hypothetical protein
LDAEEFRLLAALGKGLPVGKATEAALEDSPVPVEELRRRVETWFAAWAEMGWLCGRGVWGGPPGLRGSSRTRYFRAPTSRRGRRPQD